MHHCLHGGAQSTLEDQRTLTVNSMSAGVMRRQASQNKSETSTDNAAPGTGRASKPSQAHSLPMTNTQLAGLAKVFCTARCIMVATSACRTPHCCVTLSCCMRADADVMSNGGLTSLTYSSVQFCAAIADAEARCAGTAASGAHLADAHQERAGGDPGVSGHGARDGPGGTGRV